MESPSYEPGKAGYKMLVLRGVRVRLEELRQEDMELRSRFPKLKAFGVNGNGHAIAEPEAAPATPRRRSRRRPRMSMAARKAVSIRMKKYWADRRKAKAAKK